MQWVFFLPEIAVDDLVSVVKPMHYRFSFHCPRSSHGQYKVFTHATHVLRFGVQLYLRVQWSACST